MQSFPIEKKSSFSDMLQEIIKNDKNNENQEDFVKLTPVVFWTQLFAKYFMHQVNQEHDDLLFYVKNQESFKGEVLVHRQLSKTAPGLGDPNIDWHETVFLNMVLHQLDYQLVMGICTKENDSTPLIMHASKSMKVFPSPSHHQMQSKGEATTLTYPNIFFTVDNFEDEWSEMQLSKNQKVCVEIVATDKSNPSFICVIFFGVISHSVIYETFRQKSKSSVSDWMGKWSFGLYKAPQDPLFLRMQGPNGSGFAEMAIQHASSTSNSQSLFVSI